MKLKETSQRIPTNIDPRLQRIIELKQKEETSNITAANTEEVPVIAKITNMEAWKEIPGVHQIADLGNDPDEPQNVRLVTARIPATEIENIRKSPLVLSLKASQPLKPVLAQTIKDIKAEKPLLPPHSIARDQGGQGIIIGIIDFGCDFTHRNFLNSDGTTRIINYWNQSIKSTNNSPFGYGRVFMKEDLNNALQTDNPFNTLGIAHPNNALSPWHGTHVMDIAAGNGKGTGIPGVAPNADIIFVEIDSSDIPWEGSQVIEGNFGSSAHLLEAIQYIFQEAGERPCIINISLGTNGGPHDGTSLVEKGIDASVNQAPNRAVVIAAGNSFEDQIHTSGTVLQDKIVEMHWAIDQRDRTHNELELWYDGEDEFICEILEPNGNSIGTVKLGTNAEAIDNQDQILLFVAHRKGDPNNGDNVINIFMEKRLTGKWTIRLHGVKVGSGKFHAWIERDDIGQSKFIAPHDNRYTLGSICCGKKSIVVGSYNAYEQNTPISFFSSAGPTRDERKKPEVSAPGHHVKAAASGSLTNTTDMSGTSMAAPAVTGMIALMLAETQAHDRHLSVEEIIELLSKTVRPTEHRGWNQRYGMGRVDANAVIKELEPVPV